MVLWYLGAAFVLVAAIFQSPALDYRLIMAAAVAPVAEQLFGGPGVFGTLLAPVVVLVVVMAATQHRRLVRRRWLGVPIGLFLSLVLSGAWLHADLFWWPTRGLDVPIDQQPDLPPLGVIVLLEIVGLALLGWAWHRYGLRDPERRREFTRSGRLSRHVMAGPPPTC